MTATHNSASSAQAQTARRVVCLSGSMRFESAMREAAIDESLAGNIVVMPHVNLRNNDPRWVVGDELELKEQLDLLHLSKIDMADEVLVINPGGYVGDSTKSEIAYARWQGKLVRYWTQPEATK